MSTSLTKVYKVNHDNQPVTVSVIIGHGQVGTTSVNLGTKLVKSNYSNSLVDLALGVGSEIKGNVLFCTTTVADVRIETNLTSVTYELKGGRVTFSQTLSETVFNEGDVVFYTATFYFV